MSNVWWLVFGSWLRWLMNKDEEYIFNFWKIFWIVNVQCLVVGSWLLMIDEQR
jgi:hypothetical protein